VYERRTQPFVTKITPVQSILLTYCYQSNPVTLYHTVHTHTHTHTNTHTFSPHNTQLTVHMYMVHQYFGYVLTASCSVSSVLQQQSYNTDYSSNICLLYTQNISAIYIIYICYIHNTYLLYT